METDHTFDHRIRLLIVDDHAVVRKGLAMVLRLEPDIEIVAEAGDGNTGLELARALHPAIVLLDLVMPGVDGHQAALALRRDCPDIKIIILTGTEVDDRVFDLLAAGVDGYLLKNIEPGELIGAVHSVMKGEAYLHPEVTRRVLGHMHQPVHHHLHQDLTKRELEVLQWMASPNTYRQIASILNVSEETVRSHAKSILDKLGQPNRAQAVLVALKQGIIKL
jgi:NarL family two-component system response regulator LiaR